MRLLVLISCFVATSVTAGVNRWTESGPPRAACSGGFVHCSEIGAIAFDPSDERIVYALMSSGPVDAVERHGLWRSSDGGDTWMRLPFAADTPVDRLFSIRISPVDPQTLYVLTRDAFYRSVNGGQTWTMTLLPEWYVRNTDLAIDPLNSSVVYVAQENSCLLGSCIAGGVYRSEDGGRRWREAGLDKKWVSRLSSDPSDPSTLYAIADGRVFQTTNRGGSWREVSPAAPGVVSMIAVDPVVSSTIYAATGTFSTPFAGIFKSTDRARTWRLLEGENLTEGGSSIIAIDPGRSMHLLATTSSGIVRSTNGGESWTSFNEGFQGVSGRGAAQQLLIAPGGTTFYAVFGNGFVFRYSLVSPRRRAVR